MTLDTAAYSFIAKVGNKIKVNYEGFSPDDFQLRNRTLTLNEDFTDAVYDRIDYSNISQSETYRTRFALDLDDSGTLWGLGQVGYAPSQVGMPKDFSIEQLNMQQLKINLKLPSLNYFNPWGALAPGTSSIYVIFNQILTVPDGYLLVGNTVDITGTPIPPNEFIAKIDPGGNFQNIIHINDFGTVDTLKLSHSKELFVLHNTPTSSTIKSLSYDATELVDVKELPVGTKLQVVRNRNSFYGTEYDFYGSVSQDNEEFSAEIGAPGLITGSFDKEFNVKGAKAITVKGQALTLNNYLPYSEKDGDIKFFVSGSLIGQTGDFINKPVDGWQSKAYGNNRDVWFGNAQKTEDYAPAIKKPASIVVNLDKLKENKDNQLLAGLDGNKPLIVYDVKDSNNQNIDGKSGAQWLESRINRNPKKTEKPIDWEALGFKDNGKIGPDQVTYFVTDSQKQTTATSRWVNKVDEDTVYDAHGALGARNFTIPVEDTAELIWNTNVQR